jgi:hypothetical protein
MTLAQVRSAAGRSALAVVPVTDRPPSRLAIVWPAIHPSPLVRSFVQIAASVYRHTGKV